jgi:hypothetical protein
MADNFQPRPQVQRTTGTPQETVTARVHDYGVNAGGESPLAGLVRGLSTLNPALEQYHQFKEKRLDDFVLSTAKATGQAEKDPRAALTGAPIELPNGIPQAREQGFRTALAETLAHRVGLQNKALAVSEYNDLKDTDGFQVRTWLAEKRADALKGILDPHAQAIIGQHFTELEANIEVDAERERVVKRDEVRATTMTQVADDMFSAEMSPDKISEAYPSFLGRAKAMGYTPKESAQFLYSQLDHLSNKLGGAPELFEVFDRKDAEGITLLARNPQLAPRVDQARHQAIQQRDKALKDAAEQGNAKFLIGYESDIDQAPEKVTIDRILSDMTPYGAIRSPEQAASMWNRAQDALRRKLATESFVTDAELGRLWMHDPKDQGKVLDQLAGPMVQMLAQATSKGDSGSVFQIGAQLMQLHSRTGATVPVDQLQRYVKTMVSNLPNPEGPTATFTAAAELYKSLSANPQYRDMYFAEDTSKLLEDFTSATNAGSDAKSAYVSAYQAVGPEAKAAAEAYVKTPEFQKKLGGDIKKYVEGSSWVPRWLGGNGRPENMSVVSGAVAAEVRSFRARNPFTTDEQMDAYLEKWTGQNFALDTTTHSAVKVPSGRGGPAAQSALSAYSKKLTEDFKLASRSDADWKVQYVPLGTEGRYQVVLFNGMATEQAGQVTLQQLMDRDRVSKVLSEGERQTLSQLRKHLKDGQLPEVDMKLLAKAEALKAIAPEESLVYRQALTKRLQERVQAVPAMSFGKPSFDNLQFPQGRSSVDNQMTAKMANELMADTGMGFGYHQNYAASLIAMGAASSRWTGAWRRVTIRRLSSSPCWPPAWQAMAICASSSPSFDGRRPRASTG